MCIRDRFHAGTAALAFPTGTQVQAKFTASSRSYKSAVVLEDRGSEGLLLQFHGFTDQTVVPLQRIRPATITLANCTGSTQLLRRISEASLSSGEENAREIPSEWEAKIREMATGGRKRDRLNLPATLSSYQRRLVHALADKLGMSSQSRGRDDKRFIVVENSPQKSSKLYWKPHAPSADSVCGVLQVSRRRRAEGYVLRDDGLPDIFIPDETCRNRGLDGDYVAVELSEGVGKVCQVLERRHRVLVAGLVKPLGELPMVRRDLPAGMDSRSVKVFQPFDSRWPFGLVLEGSAPAEAEGAQESMVCSEYSRKGSCRRGKDCQFQHVEGKSKPKGGAGEVVCVQFRSAEWADASRWPTVDLLRTVGRLTDFETHLEVVAIENGVHAEEPSEEVLAECASSQAAEGPREDFRDELVLSIDPEGARDLDDALHVKEVSPGVLQIGVHIADVATAVRAGSALDQFASERATTVYLPHRNYPMLPRALCDNLCSLHGGVDRPSFSVVFTVSATTAELLSAPRFCMGQIRSVGKLSYELAQQLISHPHSQEVTTQVCDTLQVKPSTATAICDAVNTLNALAVKMRAARMKLSTRKDERPLEQPRYYVREGAVHQYADEKQAADSHHLIEEFMLLANRLVAERLLETYPEHAIVRAQPPPEGRKLQNFLRSTIQRLRTFNELIQGVRTSWVQRRGLRRCRQAAAIRRSLRGSCQVTQSFGTPSADDSLLLSCRVRVHWACSRLEAHLPRVRGLHTFHISDPSVRRSVSTSYVVRF
eukprot:TRINITY_DN8851_c0_g1_i1.p1 TRINITY_DN8851_c0_g1~~TRINITY_DN8851_c0_g1_i1.p1  ORF type:complete len:768 (+),score=128.12 TRINITY_DN8851_c0_g1_i1:115-2418(+)